MIEKQLAKIWTLHKDYQSRIESSINASIYEAIANQLFHCDWYTPAGYDAEKDEECIKEYVIYLQNRGYKVTTTKFSHTENFPNTRIKLHINWE